MRGSSPFWAEEEEMFRSKFLLFTAVCSIATTVFLSGCVVRTYTLTKDRVDQDTSAGNRGYIKGQAPAGESITKRPTRDTQVVEIELRSPVRFERIPRQTTTEVTTSRTEDKNVYGNRGYITESVTPEVAEPSVSFEKYTVQKNDTLQKISQKFFNTTKKWYKIYEANKDTMSTPNKLYPGKTINIPMDLKKHETMSEPTENLK